MAETVYVTAAEMQAIDRFAIEKRGIPAAALMERAGAALGAAAAGLATAKSALIIAGYGNNGGDGFVAARHLAAAGFAVAVIVAGRERAFSPETKANYDALFRLAIPVRAIASIGKIAPACAMLPGPGVLVDALFGIGLRDELEPFFVRLIEAMNGCAVPIVAADIPSGLDANTGRAHPVAVKATRTVTFGFPKKGFQAAEATVYTGTIVVADIGLPPLDEIRHLLWQAKG